MNLRLTGEPAQVTTRRDWIADAGIAVVAVAALISSASALTGLAKLAAWGDELSLLLPLMVDAYGITSTRIWLSKATRSPRVRRHAAGNAVAAIVMSVVGNVVYHAIQAKALVVPSWVLVVAVSVVPPVTIGLLSHLVALRSGDHAESAPRGGPAVPPPTAPESVPTPAAVRIERLPRTGPGPAPREDRRAVAARTPAATHATSSRTGVVNLAAVRDGAGESARTEIKPVDRARFIAGLVRDIRAAAANGGSWEPDYPVLEKVSGYRRSWCEKAVREAREQARTASDTRPVTPYTPAAPPAVPVAVAGRGAAPAEVAPMGDSGREVAP
ncbi:hypothetical protein [Sphaerisporangium dianthi]|uniref:DUF2637 domain-containing protein n=1 Tax=Sphaerisporangium dianthi TaxID=1436120 RepID=A0ABV9C7T4_9ACTN